MYRVEEAGHRGGKDFANVYREGRLVGGASVSFIGWMCNRVPEHQLAPEQVALIRWYEKNYSD